MKSCESVSVITVCLNSAATIQATLDSVRAQTWKNLEFIVVDGGSSDETVDILEKNSKCIDKMVSEKDEGIYDGMNKGIGLSTGDIVYFLNSDDRFWDDGVLKDVMAEFRKNREVDLIYGNVIYESDRKRWKRQFEHVNKRNILYEDICHQAVFTRRELFDIIGRFDLRYRINSDYDWLLKVFFSDIKARYYDRDIAGFFEGGFHSRDKKERIRERLEIKRKYQTPFAYRVCEVIYRGIRKFKKERAQRSRYGAF